jgi:uncharacterized membrane protein YkvA (DUF1232 family)
MGGADRRVGDRAPAWRAAAGGAAAAAGSAAAAARLAADQSLPRRVRAGLALLLAYLAFPFDLVPDFIPVLGYADDAIIVAAVLRWAVH